MSDLWLVKKISN